VITLQGLDTAPVSPEPFPHLELYPAVPESEFDSLRNALPAPDSFALKGKGLKLELDIIDGYPAFDALAAAQRERLMELRDTLQAAAGRLASRFAEPLQDKYAWLLGDSLAAEVTAAGWTTTHGRVMGRRAGYHLDPHMDSAHVGITCLLYFSEAMTPEDGALGLYRLERQPEVRDASTYYPLKEEGITSTLAKSIPIRPNLFVAFLNGPRSVHGFGRAAGASGWRFVYQCHVLPRHFRIDKVADRMDQAHRARWERLLSDKRDSARAAM
jgi:hypothetical protein